MKFFIVPRSSSGTILVTLTLLLEGCMYESVDTNSRRIALMPEPAARAILQRHLGAAWIAQPYGWTAPICGEERGTYGFGDIREVSYDSDTRTLRVVAGSGLCGRYIVVFDPVSSDAAKDIADALAALGARL